MSTSGKKSGIPVAPVYAWWLRINNSKHQYCGPASNGVVKKEWLHIEASPVRGLLGPFQKLSPANVKSDGQRFALFGHDTGPFVLHLCTPPDNALLSAALMKSKCKWPFSASRAKVGTRAPCAFQQALIPYVYCYEREKEKEEKEEKEKKENDKAPPPPAAEPAGAAAKAKEKVKTPTTAEKLELAKSQVPGFGFIMIPTGPQTVNWHLGFRDILLGVANILADLAFDYAWKRHPKFHGKPLRDRVAQRVGARWAANSPAGKKLIEAAFDKATKDWAKGLVSSADVRAPARLAKLDLNTGKVTVWTKEVGWRLPDSFTVDYPGWAPLLEPRDPVLDDMVCEVPHVD